MSRPVNISDTLTFIPSSYEDTGSYHFTHQTINNAYSNADSTTSNRMTLARSNNRTRQSELYFNFDMSALSSIPAGATITSVSSNVKYYVGSTTITAVSIQLYSGTTAKGTAITQRPTSATKYSITPGTWTLSELQNARLYVSATRNSGRSDVYLYFYGADLSVSYELNGTEYEISVNNTSSTSISPSTTQYVFEGGDLTIQINTSNKNSVRVSDNNVDVSSQVVQGTGSCTYTISNVQADHTISVTDAPSYNVSITNNSETVTTQPSSTQTLFEGDSQSITFYNISSLDDVAITDNSNDIESQLVHSTGGTRSVTLIPSSLSGNSGTVTNPNDGLSDTSSTTFAEVPGGGSYYMEYSFDTSSIPSNATINSISCSVKAEHTRTYQAIGSAQLYTGSTAKGSSYTFGSPTEVFDLTTGTWTVSELQTLKLRIGSTYTGTRTYYTRFYGAELTVNYTVQEDVYTYTITNISGNHAIAIADVAPTPYFLKVNGEYRAVKKFFRKINNTWVEIDVSQLSIAGPFFYKGWQEEIIYDVIGEVTRSSSDITIVINDNTLSPGNYTLYYEDETGNIISGVDEIANITIS